MVALLDCRTMRRSELPVPDTWAAHLERLPSCIESGFLQKLSATDEVRDLAIAMSAHNSFHSFYHFFLATKHGLCGVVACHFRYSRGIYLASDLTPTLRCMHGLGSKCTREIAEYCEGALR